MRLGRFGQIDIDFGGEQDGSFESRPVEFAGEIAVLVAAAA